MSRSTAAPNGSRNGPGEGRPDLAVRNTEVSVRPEFVGVRKIGRVNFGDRDVGAQ